MCLALLHLLLCRQLICGCGQGGCGHGQRAEVFIDLLEVVECLVGLGGGGGASSLHDS